MRAINIEMNRAGIEIRSYDGVGTDIFSGRVKGSAALCEASRSQPARFYHMTEEMSTACQAV